MGTGICYAEGEMELKATDDTDSDNEIIFTSVDADIEILTYQQDVNKIETPFSERELGMTIPTSLRHGYIVPSAILVNKPYAPSSPKSLMHLKRKRPYEPSSPRLESRRYQAIEN